MMIRKLQKEELQNACNLMHFVYENCLGMRASENLTANFRAYANPSHLEELMDAEELSLWGLWDKVVLPTEIGNCLKDVLLAVGGMTVGGQITLLYVHPRYQNRKYAAKLLEEMRRYAGTELKLERVWCNAAPAWTEGYFRKKDFVPIDPYQPIREDFVSLSAPTFYERAYEKRSLPTWLLLLLGIGSVILAVLLGVAYLILALL